MSIRHDPIQARPLTEAERQRRSRAGDGSPRLAWVRPRNGLPVLPPYTYRGSGRSLSPAEAARRLRVLDACEAIEGPSPGWYRELDDEPHPRSALATSREARAAVPVVIKARPLPPGPVSVDGQRRFWTMVPPALAARLASPRPALPAAKPRCGYLTVRCCCPGGAR